MAEESWEGMSSSQLRRKLMNLRRQLLCCFRIFICRKKTGWQLSCSFFQNKLFLYPPDHTAKQNKTSYFAKSDLYAGPGRLYNLQ